VTKPILTAVAWALLLGGAASTHAQQPGRPPAAAAPDGAGGALAGRAVLAATGEPLAFSVVALLYVEGGSLVRSALTAADGSFGFDSLAPGEYRVRLERVGFAPELQAAVRVLAGRTESTVLRSTPRRLALPATDVPDTACHAAADMLRLPALAALWREAATAAEARRLFNRRYTFTLVLRDLSWQVLGERRVRAAVGETPETHTASDATVEELRASSDQPVWGSVGPGGFRLIVPDLPELFGTGFLATHCVVGSLNPHGESRLAFRPRDTWTTPGVLRVAPTIVLDSAWTVARVELKFLLDGRTFIRGAQQYGDAAFPGGQLRFPLRLDLEEVPRLAGRPHWVGRTRFDNYQVAPDTTR